MKNLKRKKHTPIHGILMDSLENEILKYKKKGFKVAQRRTLKHGLRVYIEKEHEGFLFTRFDGIYLYYVDGDCSYDSLRECFKDYQRFYEDKEFDERDKGFYVCSGSLDEKLFKDLRKDFIDDDDIRNSIKPMSLGKEVTPRPREERELQKVKRKAEHTSLERVVNAIKSIPLVPQPKEKAYEAQLYAALNAKGFDVDYESQRRGARFDLVIGDIAIELKVVKNTSIFDSLYGQVSRYYDQFSKIIIVLIDQFRNPSVLNKEIERLKKISQNIEVIVK
jgi:hypothetical protein